jgi:drug/metabolite transporter (DMT)-like permease
VADSLGRAAAGAGSLASVTEAAFPVAPARERRPLLGYAMVLGACALWGMNGAVSKVMLKNGLSSLELVEIRSAGACLVLAAGIAVVAPRQLRVTRRELPLLVLFGVGGLAFVQLLYLIAIRRLDIGVALLIEYTAPVLVALYARFVLRQPVRNRIWAALALALAGLALIVDLAHGVTLNGVGVVSALLAAVAYALYVLIAERSLGERSAVSLLCFGFGFASLLFAVLAPWWRFPFAVLTEDASLLGNLAGTALPMWLLLASNILLGTVIPFVLLVRALRHLSATRVAIAAMAEPVVATLVAWAWLAERLGPAQLVGGAIVLAAIGLAQTAR